VLGEGNRELAKYVYVVMLHFTGNFCVVFCFQCGRPYSEDNCRTCGARIGGQNHRLVADNAQIAELVYAVIFLSLIGSYCW